MVTRYYTISHVTLVLFYASRTGSQMMLIWMNLCYDYIYPLPMTDGALLIRQRRLQNCPVFTTGTKWGPVHLSKSFNVQPKIMCVFFQLQLLTGDLKT